MTHSEDLSLYLDPVGLGAWRYYPVAGSTNDLALAWASEGAPDWSLVVADTQTAGRGRGDRRWVTEPGCALALSLVLRPSLAEARFIAHFTALAALGLIQALSDLGLKAVLKWPNDILLAGKKVAGVLVEVDWESDQVNTVVIGMGVNVSPGSVPLDMALRYPAAAIESELGAPVNRWALLAATLGAIRDYQKILTTQDFHQAWNQHLAFRDEWVRFRIAENPPERMKVLGVQNDGRLNLKQTDGRVIATAAGEILMAADAG